METKKYVELDVLGVRITCKNCRVDFEGTPEHFLKMMAKPDFRCLAGCDNDFSTGKEKLEQLQTG